MEEKYYTPTIHEFYVGFEYEQLVSDFLNGFSWEKITITYPKHIGQIINLSGCRVEYLNKEDIESLGWKEHINSRILQGNTIYFQKKTVCLKIQDIHLEIWNSTQILFSGAIKNKSELKKLMQQLKII